MSEATLSGIGLPLAVTPATTGAPPLGPVRAEERVELVDVLRGFALFGILQTNFSDWGGVLTPLINFFIDGSFYTTYSLLFGLGFSIQMIRAENAGRPFVLRYAWRSVLLFAIGTTHFVFIWWGDILHRYAVLAFALLTLRRLPNWLLLTFAGASLLITIPRWDAQLSVGTIMYRPSPEASDSARIEAAIAAQHHVASLTWGLNGGMGRFADRDYGNRVRARLDYVTSEMTAGNPFSRLLRSWGDVLCMFIIGLVCGRKQIFRDPARYRVLLVRVAIWGGLLGVIGNLYDTFPDLLESHDLMPAWLNGAYTAGLVYSVGNIALSLFYVASLTLLFTYRQRARRFLAPFASAGRMGLTNYLMQSVAFSLLLWRPGLNLDTVLGRWHQQLLLTAFFLLQLLYSRWWFRRFQFGPVEWAWRSLTWLRVQPLRRVEDAIHEAA